MKTILVVDDEQTLVENLVDVFVHKGFRVVTAANGVDGLERAIIAKPDLVLTDFMMPICDGRWLVLSLRALSAFATTPIIMMSASSRSIAESDGAGRRLPVDAFLAKPLSAARLIEAVVALIGPADAPDA